MKITLVCDARLPVARYGGTERVVWGLGKALARLGHEVTLLARPGSQSPFGRVIPLRPDAPLAAQIPADTDIVHFQNVAPPDVRQPYVVTVHGNATPQPYDKNNIYVSADHARRHGSTRFVHNGLEWDDYPAALLDLPRRDAFFLGNGAWRVKNLKGAIRIAHRAGCRLDVLGARRLNLKMGLRFYPQPWVRFHGMVGDERKSAVASRSRGLLFPVLWPEPFGLAAIEAMYFGAPVFATPRGALPELVNEESGFLSESEEELAEALRSGSYDPHLLHDRARTLFSSEAMARRYLAEYARTLR